MEHQNWDQKPYQMDRNNWQQKPYAMDRENWEPEQYEMEPDPIPTICDNQHSVQIIIKTDRSMDRLLTDPQAPPCHPQQQYPMGVPRRPYRQTPYWPRPWSRSPEEPEHRGDDYEKHDFRKEVENPKIMFTTPPTEPKHVSLITTKKKMPNRIKGLCSRAEGNGSPQASGARSSQCRLKSV